ncbi:hypothetical protein CAL7102_02084 [Dulcicalothrix desertica PCC 7102]|nr:hypothetical protein CAL7102_02084 [Dulcicalothrix desertica PCC 7102]
MYEACIATESSDIKASQQLTDETEIYGANF